MKDRKTGRGWLIVGILLLANALLPFRGLDFAATWSMVAAVLCLSIAYRRHARARNWLSIRPQQAQEHNRHPSLTPNPVAVRDTWNRSKDSAPRTSNDPIKKLQELGELRAKGVLTDDEFQATKRRLLKDI